MNSEAAASEKPVLGGKAWAATLAAAWVAQFASMTGFSFVMPFLPFYLRELGVHGQAAERYWSGFVISAPALTMMLAAPVWGILADRFGRKLMVMRAMFGGAITIALMGFAGSPEALLGLRLIQGALTGTVSATNALVSGVTPRERAGFSIGLMQTAIYAGHCVGPLLGGMCADAFGYPATFVVAGCCLLIGGAIVAMLVDEGPRANGGKDAAPAESLGSVLARPGFAVVIGLVTLLHFAGTVLGPIFPLYVETLVDDKLRVNTEAGRLIAVTALCSSLVAMPVGWVADRIGPRRILVLGTFLSGVLVAPQAFVGSIGSLYGLRMALGLAAGAIGPAMGSFVNRTVPRESQGKAFGLVQSATSLGFGLGPVAGGAMGAHLGLRAPFVVVGAIQVLFALTACFALRRAEGRLAGRPEDDGRSR